MAVDYTSTWELLKSFAPLEDEVVAPNTMRLGGYTETISCSSSSSFFSFSFSFLFLFLFFFSNSSYFLLIPNLKNIYIYKKEKKKSKTASFQVYLIAALTDL